MPRFLVSYPGTGTRRQRGQTHFAANGLQAFSIPSSRYPSFRGLYEKSWRKKQRSFSLPHIGHDILGLRTSGRIPGHPWRMPMEDSSGPTFSSTGSCPSSGAPMVPASCLAIEREILRKDHFSAEVISTLLASRRRSTTRIYDATWSSFHCWCASSGIDPTRVSIPQVLDFLQASLNTSLAVNTLRRQVSALATVLPCKDHGSLSQHPCVCCFLQGASNHHPPTVHRYPSWDLGLVLQVLADSPFEPLSSASLKFLTFKVAFLVTVTSAC